MNSSEYLLVLSRLGLSPASRCTAAALGVTVRQCQRYAAGDANVSGPIWRLLQMYLRYGVPPDWFGTELG
jgi:hypothetical protein